jgi:hypothetical protein
MRKKLHPVVLVVAILQIVFGVFGLVGPLFGLYGSYELFENAKTYAAKFPDQGSVNREDQVGPLYNRDFDEDPPENDDVIDQVAYRHPTYKYAHLARHSFALLLAPLMIGGGIGLLFMHKWARYLTLGYCALSILHSLGVLLYGSIVYLPAILKINRELNEMGEDQAEFAIGIRISVFFVALFALILAAYPVIVAVMLLIPPVSRAFRGGPVDRDADKDRGRYDDNERDDYRRRFRDDYRRRFGEDEEEGDRSWRRY